ncbi:MAG TPA: type II toxin-antitoxin system PemK/MazF family toxin [Pirellulales bacterium]|nr:type II toxin-antitoxin system PemK/MazF family toxin [Pirellulales bacterium]
MAAPRQGRIVWAVMRDRQGGNEKCRPGVIVSGDDEIEANRSFFVVAIGTSFVEPPSEYDVPLPSNTSGTARTKLRKKAVAVCKWLVEVTPGDVEDYGGVVPTQVMNKILEIVARLPE